MKNFLFSGLLALASLSAPAAQFFASNGPDSLLLDDQVACSAPLDSAIRAQHKVHSSVQFHAAKAVIGGKAFEACWVPVGDGVAIFYEDGDVGMLPQSEFQKLKKT